MLATIVDNTAMMPEYPPGTLVLADENIQPGDSDLCIALTHHWTLVRGLRIEDGQCSLIPMNPGYATLDSRHNTIRLLAKVISIVDPDGQPDYQDVDGKSLVPGQLYSIPNVPESEVTP